MKYLFSRYGGHLVIPGKGKASDDKLPEDQSLKNLFDNHAFKMNGFSYLSSYEMLPEFMGAYQYLPTNAVKIADMEHDFTDVFFQAGTTVNSSIYIAPYQFSNIFSCFIKTDLKPLEDDMGKLEQSYDCVLVLRISGKSNEEIKNEMGDFIINVMGTLLYEMDLKDDNRIIKPSNTYLGKKINMKKIHSIYKTLPKMEDRKMLADELEKITKFKSH